MAMAPLAKPVIQAIQGGASPKPMEDGVEVQAVYAAAQWLVDNKHTTNGLGNLLYEARDNGDVFIGINYVGGESAPTSKIGTKWHAGRYDGLSWRAATG